MPSIVNPKLERGAASQRHRRAVGMLDLFVSLTLLTAVFTAVIPLVVRHGRLVQSQRHYRVALDELSNQLERLTALPSGQLSDAMQHLAPTSFAAERLVGATLAGNLEPAEGGSRIVLKLLWDEPGRREAPVTMAAWVFPTATASSNKAEGAQP